MAISHNIFSNLICCSSPLNFIIINNILCRTSTVMYHSRKNLCDFFDTKVAIATFFLSWYLYFGNGNMTKKKCLQPATLVCSTGTVSSHLLVIFYINKCY
jgi:hypothetical protein